MGWREGGKSRQQRGQAGGGVQKGGGGGNGNRRGELKGGGGGGATWNGVVGHTPNLYTGHRFPEILQGNEDSGMKDCGSREEWKRGWDWGANKKNEVGT